MALAQAAAAIEKEIPSPPGPNGLHALGLVDLWSYRSADAIAHLEAALIQAPTSAAIRNDLAVALLARASEQSDALSSVRALDTIVAAEELAPNRPEVAFNSAVLLTKLGLGDSAKRHWQRFLGIETDAAWKAEAAARLLPLEGPSYLDAWNASKDAIRVAVGRGASAALARVAEGYRQPLRQWGEDDILPEWGAAMLAGKDSDARRNLGLAVELGRAVRQMSGDSMLEEAAGVLARAEEVSDKNRLRTLARGHKTFGTSLNAYRVHDIAAALAGFAAAEAALTEGGSPFRHWATFFRAACLYQLSRYPESARAFADLGALIRDSTYLSLRGRVFWSEGVIHYATGFPTAAQHDYEEAFRIFGTAGEQENAATMQVLLAEIYFDYYGLHNQAWDLLVPALALQSRCLDSRRRQLILTDAAIAAASAGLPRAAGTFVSPAVDAAADAVEEATARLRRADYYVRGDSAELARLDIERVRELLRSITDAEVRNVVEADLRLAEGTVVHRARPRVAIDSLSEAVRLYEVTHGRLGLLASLTARGELLGQVGRIAEARIDLTRAAQLLREIGAETSDARAHQDFLDRRFRLIDVLVSVELAVGDGLAALARADQFRGLNRGGGATESSPDWYRGPAPEAHLRASMQPGALTLYFALLPDRLVTWSITSAAVRRVDAMLTRAEVLSRLRQVSSEGFTASGLAVLFDLLLGPFAAELRAARNITIVPDRELSLVPFAALEDGSTGRFLVESHTVQMAPSLDFAAADPSVGPPLQRVFAIGDPAIDEALSVHLQSLPESAGEASEIAALYHAGEVLLGPGATPSRFFALALNADVIHVSAHSVPGGTGSPGRLLLAAEPSRQGSGVLSASELEKLHLAKRPLVFLSACHGAAGSTSESAGQMSLANAFLKMGASSVIAALWPVEDRAARTLAVEFHRHFLRSADPSAALRLAQLALKSSGHTWLSNPATWGAFVLLRSFRDSPHG